MRITPFRELYQERKCRWIAHLIRESDSCIERSVTFHAGTIRPIHNQARRVGRPKNNWTVEGLKELWKRTVDCRLSANPDFDYTSADDRNDLEMAVWLRPQL